MYLHSENPLCVYRMSCIRTHKRSEGLSGSTTQWLVLTNHLYYKLFYFKQKSMGCRSKKMREEKKKKREEKSRKEKKRAENRNNRREEKIRENKKRK